MGFWRGNMKDVNENGTFKILPDGEYVFEVIDIEEKTTKSNDPMASITLTLCNNTENYGNVWDNIVFPYPDSPAINILGRSKHFLHCIGEPYDGEDLEVDPKNWLGKKVKASVKQESYTGKDNKQKTKVAVSNYILQEEEVTAWEEEDQPAL